MDKPILIRRILLFFLLIALTSSPLYGKDDKVQPKEFGVYIKTETSMVRLLPNMVMDERGILYIESNNPQHFFLKDIEYFVVYGKYNMEVLTLNPMLFFQASVLGKLRFMFGKDIEIDIKNRGGDLYIVKPQTLMGRGYHSLWIEDTAWDFFIE